MGEIRQANRKLEKLRSLCVYESDEERKKRQDREAAEQQRLSQMSPLERFAYQTTKEVNDLQQRQVQYNDKVGSDPAYTNSKDAVASRNEMNRMKMNLRQKADRIPPAKTDEEKKARDSLKKVLDRVKKSDRTPSARGSDVYANDTGNPLLDGEHPSGSTEWDGENVPGGGYEPITLDAEFQSLMVGFQKQDQEIDRMLEMTQHGVQGLHQQAKLISQELKVQDVLINEAEKKMDNITVNLQGVNKKLKKAVESVKQDQVCMYVICLMLLLGLAGVIFFMTRGSK